MKWIADSVCVSLHTVHSERSPSLKEALRKALRFTVTPPPAAVMPPDMLNSQ